MIIEIRISEIAVKTATQEDTHNNQDLGTNLFIRKNMPGSQVGRGYTVDVFENGIKVDTIVEHNKERVLELVKKYKQFYHTDRAFQNEIQLHVTYKRRKDEEKGAMDISKELTKRASRIQELSQRLIFPNEMVKKFADDLNPEGLGTPPVHQVTPSEAMNDTAPSESVDSIVKKVVQKLVKYIESGNYDEAGNEYKSWTAQLDDVIKENNNANPSNKLDIIEIKEKLKNILHSGDPSKYEEIGVSCSLEVSEIIKKLSLIAISSKGGDVNSDAAEGGEITAENVFASEKKVIKVADMIDKFLGGMRRAEDGIPLSEKDNQFIKDNAGEIISKIPDGGTEEQSSLKALAEQSKSPTDPMNPLQPVSQVQQPHVSASEFFKFVKTAGIVGDLDKVFLSWASCRFSSLEEIGAVWSNVYAEATGAFIKKADMLDVLSPGTCPIFEEAYKKILSGITEDNTKNQELILNFNASKPAVFSELLKAYLNSEYPKFKTNLKSMEIQAKSQNRFTRDLTSLLNTQSKYYNSIHPDINFSAIWTDVLAPFITEFETYALQNYNKELKLITG